MIRVFSKPKRPTQSIHYHCLRKRKHQTSTDAVAAAKQLTKRFKKKYCVYRCYYCTTWHVGADRTKTFKYLARKGVWGKQAKKIESQ